MAQDFISGAMAYLNGKAQFFDIVNHLGFNFDEEQDKYLILDKEAKFDGKIIFSMFNIIEGGGGLIYSQESHPELVKECKSTCKLGINDIVLSNRCLVCQKKSNNVGNPATRFCEKNCGTNYKNLQGFCIKCSESNCADHDMPKMNV